MTINSILTQIITYIFEAITNKFGEVIHKETVAKLVEKALEARGFH